MAGGTAEVALPSLEEAAAEDPGKGLREHAARPIVEVREAQQNAAKKRKESP